jgi:heptosyltransferase-1
VLAGEHVELPPAAGHVIDENLALLRPLGIEAVGGRDFLLPRFPAEAETVDRALVEAGIAAEDLVILNPGGGWPEKLWAAESFGALARGLRDRGLRALVSWGPGEEPLADRVAAASGGAAARCFPTTLRAFVELARRARLVVAADTGPLHLACAVGTPVVALFGPTDPARNGPFAPADIVLRTSSPAGAGDRFRVPSADMREIAVDQVLDAASRRLALERGPRAVAL